MSVTAVPAFSDDVAELSALAGMVKRSIESGTPAKSIAVLARTNSTLAAVARLFDEHKIPYQHLGQRRARLDQEAIRGAIAYARCALNPADDFAVMRALTCPLRDSLRAKDFDKRMRQGAEGGSLFAAVRRAKAWALDGELAALETFEGTISDLSAAFQTPEWADAFGAHLDFLSAAHRAAHFDTKAAEIEWFRSVLVDYVTGKIGGRRRVERTPRGFVFWTVMGQGANEHDPEADAVTLSTVHLAKGLEWGTVFIPGLVERVFPSSQAIDAGDTTEELRVAFVAFTRARDRLTLTSCRSISPSYGGLAFPATPSRFLRYTLAD